MKKVFVFILLLFIGTSFVNASGTIGGTDTKYSVTGALYYNSEYGIMFTLNGDKARLLTKHDSSDGDKLYDSQDIGAEWSISSSEKISSLCYTSVSFGFNSVKANVEECDGIKLLPYTPVYDCNYNMLVYGTEDYEVVAGNIPLSFDISGNTVLLKINDHITTKLDTEYYEYEVNGEYFYSGLFMQNAFTDEFISEYEKNGSCPNLGYYQLGNGSFDVGLQDGQYDLPINIAGSEEPDPDETIKTIITENPIPNEYLEDIKFTVELKEKDGEKDICLTPVKSVYSEYTECLSNSAHKDSGIIYFQFIKDYNKLDVYIDVNQSKLENFEKIYINYNENSSIYMYLSFILEDTLSDYEYEYDYEVISGDHFSSLIGSIRNLIEINKSLLTKRNVNLNLINNFTLGNRTFDEYPINTEFCTGEMCVENFEYYLSDNIRDVLTYCNNNLGIFLEDNFEERKNECLDFINFYELLISQQVIENFFGSCGFISIDLADFLNRILGYIAIFAPILAVLLGTVDFIKVIANGDAEKEMKSAFKKFMIRIGMAIALIIAPIIISFILNLFAFNGHNSDNPFCGLEYSIKNIEDEK